MRKILFLLLSVFMELSAEAPQNVIVVIADGLAFAHLDSNSKSITLPWAKWPTQLAMSTPSASGNGYEPKSVLPDPNYIYQNPTDIPAALTALFTGQQTWDSQLYRNTDTLPLPTFFDYSSQFEKHVGIVHDYTSYDTNEQVTSNAVLLSDSLFFDGIQNALRTGAMSKNGFVLEIRLSQIHLASLAQKDSLISQGIRTLKSTVDSVEKWLIEQKLEQNTLLILASTQATLQGKRSNQLAPFFATGPASESFLYEADEWDPQHHYYLRNTDVGRHLLRLWNPPPQIPRYTFLLIADGCGYNCYDAGFYYAQGADSSSYIQWTQFPISTFSAAGNSYSPRTAQSDATYVKLKPTDSAASGSAFSTGIKTYDAGINVDMEGHSRQTLSEAAHLKGMASGVISSMPFAHATPASMVAHKEHRTQYTEIAQEMLMQSHLDVIMGAGHPWYNDNGQPLNQDSLSLLDSASKANHYAWVGGDSVWNILREGKLLSANQTPWTLRTTKKELERLAQTTPQQAPQKLLGLPPTISTLQQRRQPSETTAPAGTVPRTESMPSLATLALAALPTLQRNPYGFFLMVEGGAVDQANHANDAGRMVEEKVEFDQMIDSILAWIDAHDAWHESLVIITADHETGYITGPNSKISADSTASLLPIVNYGKGKQPGMMYHTGSHTNQLVPLFAKGIGVSELTSTRSDWDPQRGYFSDNAKIGQILQRLYREGKTPEARPIIETPADSISTSSVQMRIQDKHLWVNLSNDLAIQLNIYNASGKRIRSLYKGNLSAGSHAFQLLECNCIQTIVLEFQNKYKSIHWFGN